MKFDIIVGNPPYNENLSINLNRKGKHHLPSKQIHRTFLTHSLSLLEPSGKLCYIMPVNRWWYVSNKSTILKSLKLQGLVAVKNIGNPFPNPVINNIGLFYFDRQNTDIDIEDDFQIETYYSLRLRPERQQTRLETNYKTRKTELQYASP